MDEVVFPQVVTKMTRELKMMGAMLDRDSGRALVDLYYQLQEHRKGLHNQIRAIQQGVDEPGGQLVILPWFAEQISALEASIPKIMDTWTDKFTVGKWSKEQKGIGPILAAGLLAHIDIRKAETAGSIWRFAGLDPTLEWKKGQKRPYNARLKLLCWKIGDSFVKQSGREDAYYGKLYRERKQYELDRDESGGNAETAAKTLAERNIKDKATRQTYESGHLPAGRLDLRARRWAVKLFLAHWHEIAFEAEFGESPPNPYPIAILGHAHKIDPPK